MMRAATTKTDPSGRLKSPDSALFLAGVMLVMLSQDNFGQSNTLTNGLVAYFPFDGDANDGSGHGNNGIPQGNSQYSFGVDGMALQLDGTGYIQVRRTNSLGMSESAERSIAVWVKPEGFPQNNPEDNHTIISKYEHFNPTVSEYYASILWETGTAEDKRITLTGTGVDAVKAGQVASGQWLHLVFILTAGPTGSRIYQNGSLIGSGSVTYNTTFQSEDVLIGANHRAGEPPCCFYVGAIDELRIYDRVLEENEILELFRRGLGPYLARPLHVGDQFQFTLVGDVGRAYEIQFSIDFTTWTTLTNFVSGTGTNPISDRVNSSQRFYRALRQP